MKLAILSCFPPYRGGISQFNCSLAEELRRQGHDVFPFNFTRQYPEILFPGKTQFLSQADRKDVEGCRAVLDSINPLSWRRSVKTIAQCRPDVVLVRYWMSWFAPCLGYVTRKLRKRGIKVVSILDNVVPHEKHFFDTPLTKYFLKGSDGCVTLCKAVGKDLLALSPGKRHVVLPHPLYDIFGEAIPRDEALHSLGLDPARKTLMFFGLIREYKGLDILLEAFGDLGNDYQLIIAGEPYGSFDRYQQIIDRTGTSNRIFKELSFIDESQVSLYFSAADLCVLPYRSATQSGVSAISYHFGVPMLVTDVGGLKESVRDEGCGMVVTKPEAQCIRTGIEHFFSDPQIAVGCKKNCLRMKESLSWPNYVGGLCKFIESL